MTWIVLAVACLVWALVATVMVVRGRSAAAKPQVEASVDRPDDDAATRLAEIETALTARDLELTRVRERNTVLEESAKRSASEIDRVPQLETALVAAAAERDRAWTKVAELESELAGAPEGVEGLLARDLAGTRSRLAEREEELTTSQTDGVTLRNRVAELEAALAGAVAERDRAWSTAAEHEAGLSRARTETLTRGGQAGEAAVVLADTRLRLIELEGEHAGIAAERDSLRARTSELEERSAALEATATALRGRNAELEGSLEEARRAEVAAIRARSAAESARAEAETARSAAVLAAAVAPDAHALLRPLWVLEVLRADREWRMLGGPLDLREEPATELDLIFERELDRLREIVGVGIEFAGRIGVEVPPATALVALRLTQEIVNEVARAAERVSIAVGEDAGTIEVELTWDGWDGTEDELVALPVLRLAAGRCGGTLSVYGEGLSWRADLSLPVSDRV